MSLLNDLSNYFSQCWVIDTTQSKAIYLRSFDVNIPVGIFERRYKNKEVSFKDILLDKNLHINVYTLANGKLIEKRQPSIGVDYKWPNTGLFNHDGVVYLANKLSTRNMTKGINQKTFNVGLINSFYYEYLKLPVVRSPIFRSTDPFTHRLFQSIYFAKYPSMSIALTLLLDDPKTHAVAISPKYALTLKPGYNKLVIYNYNIPIGTFTRNTGKFSLLTDDNTLANKVLHDDLTTLLRM